MMGVWGNSQSRRLKERRLYKQKEREKILA